MYALPWCTIVSSATHFTALGHSKPYLDDIRCCYSIVDFYSLARPGPAGKILDAAAIVTIRLAWSQKGYRSFTAITCLSDKQRSSSTAHAMNFVQRISKRLPSYQAAPTLEQPKSRGKSGFTSTMAFFRRPLKLRGNSKISVPLGVVLLFPCVVLSLIIVLFVRHHNASEDILRPAGGPPAIR